MASRQLENTKIIKNMQLHEIIKQHRQIHFKTQLEFSKKAGIPNSYYSGIENGTKTPAVKTINKILKAFCKKSIEQLVLKELTNTLIKKIQDENLQNNINQQIKG